MQRCIQTDVFRLMDLPRELWLRICKLAVKYDGIIDITVALGGRYYPKHLKQAMARSMNRAKLQQPAIACTSRVLRYECLPVYYRDNVFLGHGQPGGESGSAVWLHQIGSANRKLLQRFYCERYRTSYLDIPVFNSRSYGLLKPTSVVDANKNDDGVEAQFSDQGKLSF